MRRESIWQIVLVCIRHIAFIYIFSLSWHFIYNISLYLSISRAPLDRLRFLILYIYILYLSFLSMFKRISSTLQVIVSRLIYYFQQILLLLLFLFIYYFYFHLFIWGAKEGTTCCKWKEEIPETDVENRKVWSDYNSVEYFHNKEDCIYIYWEI